MIEERPDRSTEVVLLGRSNVGKSTLMRELTGHSFDTGRRPGVTQAANHYDWTGPDFVLTDLPGFGFMEGVEADRREEIKTAIVRYLEEYADQILVGILVLDANSAVEIIDRHADRGEVPHDVELFGFLQELGIPTVVAVNKMDKADDRDETLDAIAERLGLHPPWQQWQDTIAPITAKRGSIEPMTEAVGEHLRDQKREDLLQFFS
ncbi:GTP-binding protein [Salinarchaeum sp. Harcht-Bsk1]|uniref:GTP-binding protein EngB n=1 Tax=Salinarchaeum sp. Harcht-Bsk1 TaxID=1333523 RepID=UPI0003424787|nr:GTP-binding protein EngB [Salinarchaeum sp. Harcht-Bsk1]AGN00597.1 GTP-binding protein [Salinarchaeum sp. Harcht-Bsk1]